MLMTNDVETEKEYGVEQKTCWFRFEENYFSISIFHELFHYDIYLSLIGIVLYIYPDHWPFNSQTIPLHQTSVVEMKNYSNE